MFKINGFPVEIVILRCPYINMDNPKTRDLFSKMMYLKYKGYGNRHALGSLPLDTTDYIADHPLICIRDNNGELIPVCGSKVMTYETCQFFNLEFAMESCFKKANKDVHLRKLFEIIGEAKKNQKTLAYHGGYTIDPLIGAAPKEREMIRDFFIGITLLYFKENNISELLGLGVPHLKTDKFFYQWGYERVCVDHQDLDAFPLHFLCGVDGVMMHLKQFSPEFLKLSEKYVFLLKNKTELGAPLSSENKTKIAA